MLTEVTEARVKATPSADGNLRDEERNLTSLGAFFRAQSLKTLVVLEAPIEAVGASLTNFTKERNGYGLGSNRRQLETVQR